MDDTIAGLVEAWVSYLNSHYGTKVSTQDITDWNIKDFFPDISMDDVYGALEDEELWKMVRPKDEAIYYVKKLIDDGHRVYILTSSYYKSIVQKMEHVLFKYFPYITWNDVIIAHDKQMVRGDILIDDGVHNHEGGNHIGILMDAPHNKWFDATANGITRMKTWKEIYRFICDICEDRNREVVK